MIRVETPLSGQETCRRQSTEDACAKQKLKGREINMGRRLWGEMVGKVVRCHGF